MLANTRSDACSPSTAFRSSSGINNLGRPVLVESEVRDPVAQDLLVHAYKNQALKLSLCHKQAVEWISMQLRKRPGQLCLLNRNWQGQEIVRHNGLLH